MSPPNPTVIKEQEIRLWAEKVMVYCMAYHGPPCNERSCKGALAIQDILDKRGVQITDHPDYHDAEWLSRDGVVEMIYERVKE